MDWTLTNPDVPAGDDLDLLESGTHQVRQGLAGYLQDLGMIDRATWGAEASSGCGYDGNKYRAAIHHTASPAGDAGQYDQRIRQIQSYHINGNGWCDIGYHFLVTQDGQLWEGRPVSYRGAHVGGNNSGNAGITMVGCFEPGACDPSTFGPLTPSQESENALASLVGILSFSLVLKSMKPRSRAPRPRWRKHRLSPVKIYTTVSMPFVASLSVVHPIRDPDRIQRSPPGGGGSRVLCLIAP